MNDRTRNIVQGVLSIARVSAIALTTWGALRSGTLALEFTLAGAVAGVCVCDMLNVYWLLPMHRRAIAAAQRAGMYAALEALPKMRCVCGHLGTSHVIDSTHRPDSPGPCKACSCPGCDFTPEARELRETGFAS